jgi:hypothetical protein
MTDVTYDNTSSTTSIGPLATNSGAPAGGLFGTIAIPGNKICRNISVNTSTLTPAGPYTTLTERSIAVRIYSDDNSHTHILSIGIGFTAA